LVVYFVIYLGHNYLFLLNIFVMIMRKIH